jgi:hypothetical protein
MVIYRTRLENQWPALGGKKYGLEFLAHIAIKETVARQGNAIRLKVELLNARVFLQVKDVDDVYCGWLRPSTLKSDRILLSYICFYLPLR